MRTLLICLILLVIDWYVFQAFRFIVRDLSITIQKTVPIFYWFITIACLTILITGYFIDWQTWPKALRTYLFAFIFITYFSKLFIIIFLLVDDIGRLFRWIYEAITGNRKNSLPESTTVSNSISRSDFMVKTGLIISAIPFISLLYGMVNGAYNYKVKKIKLPLSNLPVSFEGLKIVHISDIHSGSFNSSAPLKRAVEMINELSPDVVFFTGDLVNDRSTEALPYMDVLKEIKAPFGVFSTFGNHDYGDYVQWESVEAKTLNLENLKIIHRDLGWNLLFDQHHHLEKNGEKIGLVGIQNWSSHLRFPKYGSMEKAVHQFDYAPVNILLSHDPSHWRSEVLEKYPKIDLMLAGHTHGFQFGIEIPGIRWSPVQYVYKEWGGLYSTNNQHLYVNRGLGFLGYPGRVGILPEITQIILTRG